MVPGLLRPRRLRPDVPLSAAEPSPPASVGRIVVALLTTALVAGLIGWHDVQPVPRRLDDWALAGARGPACLRLVLADDVSGSMASFASARDHAVDALRSWAPRNLRPDDQLGTLPFAAEAVWARTPVSVDAAAGSGPPPQVADGRDTLLGPVLDHIAALPPSPCDTVLLLVSDAQLSDLPDAEPGGRVLLRAAGVHDIALLVPGDGIAVPDRWQAAFPSAVPQRFDGQDADASAVAVARVVAALTGQDLVRR